MSDPLEAAQRELLASARRATLATTTKDGRARLVPICYWTADEPDATGRTLIYSPLDEKPKSGSDPHDLARVRDIVARPQVSLLVDHWDEDWSSLRWLRLEGSASLLEPDGEGEHAAAVAGLRRRYRQYRDQDLEGRPMLRVAVERAVSWSAAG
jgi:PPOX class probable F420-dependent enzyme